MYKIYIHQNKKNLKIYVGFTQIKIKCQQVRKNKPKSEDAKKNMSNAKKGSKHPNFGKTWRIVNGKRVYSKKAN